MIYNVFNGGPWAEDEKKFALIGVIAVAPAETVEQTNADALAIAKTMYGGNPAVAPATQMIQ